MYPKTCKGCINKAIIMTKVDNKTEKCVVPIVAREEARGFSTQIRIYRFG